MPKLLVLKPKAVLKILTKNEFIKLRQIGSHTQLCNPNTHLRVTVPMHNKDLKRKTLKSIFSQAKIKY